jgi:hypothetical protein
MAVKSPTFADLLAEGAELERLGESIQGERELTASGEELREFADRYLRWMADALAVLPEDLAAKFRNEYEGGVFTPKIKKFLEAPGELSPLYNVESTSALFPYWQYTFDSAFRAPLLAQRQILLEAQARAAVVPASEHLVFLERIWRRLPLFLAVLGDRQRGRPGFAVDDEYDLQDVFHAALRLFFDDVRPEEWTPSYAGRSSRMDFLFKEERTVVEMKMTRDGLGERELGDDLVQDIARYRAHPDCDALAILVVDRIGKIKNPRGFERDLSGIHGDLLVQVVVVQ